MSHLKQILGGLSRCLQQATDGSFFAEFEGYRLHSAFQPIYHSNGQLFGYEALLRVIDRYSQALLPDRFFEFFRLRPALRIEIDRLVRVMHIRNFSACFAEKNLFLNMNPDSLADVRTQNLLRMYFSGYLSEVGMSVGQVYIEVIEEGCDQEEKMLASVHSLRQEGFRFAVDDYGCGASLEPRVKSIRPEMVKMDKRLLLDYLKGKTEPLIQAVSVARENNAKVLVEGIESKAAFEAAKAIQADYMQGYFLGQPLLSTYHLAYFE